MLDVRTVCLYAFLRTFFLRFDSFTRPPYKSPLPPPHSYFPSLLPISFSLSWPRG